MPADRYIPDAFRKHVVSSHVSFPSKSQEAGITLISPSLSGRAQDDQGFASGDGISDDFKLWLSRHPGLTIGEALHRFREEQKAKLSLRHILSFLYDAVIVFNDPLTSRIARE